MIKIENQLTRDQANKEDRNKEKQLMIDQASKDDKKREKQIKKIGLKYS